MKPISLNKFRLMKDKDIERWCSALTYEKFKQNKEVYLDATKDNTIIGECIVDYHRGITLYDNVVILNIFRVNRKYRYNVCTIIDGAYERSKTFIGKEGAIREFERCCNILDNYYDNLPKRQAVGWSTI